MASADNQPKSREEVRSETTQANKAGELRAKGETDKPPVQDKKDMTHKAGKSTHDGGHGRDMKRAEGAEAAKNPDPTGGVYNPAKKTTP